MVNYYQIDDKIVRAFQLPASLIDLARSQRVDIDKMLKGSKLFESDTTNADKCISIDQFEHMLGNAGELDRSGEIALRLGRQLPYTVPSELLQAITHSNTVAEALSLLSDYSALYYPGYYMQLVSDDHLHFLFVSNALGNSRHETSMLAVLLSSIITLIKQANVDTSNIQLLLKQAAPLNRAPLLSYLGSNIQFRSPVTAIAVPAGPWRYGVDSPNQSVRQAALAKCDALAKNMASPFGFIEQLHRFLYRDNNFLKANLAACADHFSVSDATFKRRLKKHNTNFQTELDKVKKHIAIKLLLVDEMSNDETAAILGINDQANFRRSFKRWTGDFPNVLRRQLISIKHHYNYEKQRI